MTLKHDRYYTPDWLAEEMAALLPAATTSVVDLSAGGGSLLEAAVRRFGSVSIVAADLDPRAVRNLRVLHPEWRVSCANSLSQASYRSSAAYRQRAGGYDAVLLNPPFSYRGGARTEVLHNGITHKVTPATAFIAHALDWIGPSGVIVAIVPKNVMDIRSDSDLWRTWKSELRVDRARVLARHTFRSARTTAMVVTLRRSQPRRKASFNSGRPATAGAFVVPPRGGCKCVELVRGRVPVYRSRLLRKAAGVPYVHTTMLRRGRLRLTDDSLSEELASVGPMILLPRVGKPSREKVVRSGRPRLVLSDCVIGIRTLDPRLRSSVHQIIVDEFDDFAGQYTGSCAPYVTIARLCEWLGMRGFCVSHVAPSSNPGWCCCREADAEPA
jgi:predicted RNA methylase